MTRSGQVSFFSRTPVEDIDAVTNEATSIINTSTGDVAFAVLVKSFRFKKALMEEHFNENYMESDKFPKATFNGKIINTETIDFHKNGSYPVTVQGDLTIHGITNHVIVQGLIVVTGNQLSVTSTFSIRPEDYGIKIPSIVSDKIAREIEVNVKCIYNPKA
ncbi:MAG: YceI family protein [Cyclobacteriaceae bacterium]